MLRFSVRKRAGQDLADVSIPGATPTTSLLVSGADLGPS